MTIETDLKKIAEALDTISRQLAQPRPPMFTSTPDALDQLFPPSGFVSYTAMPRVTDASQVYLSGTWKRRDGHWLYDTSTTPKTPAQRGDPHATLDPWVRVDVPAIDP